MRSAPAAGEGGAGCKCGGGRRGWHATGRGEEPGAPLHPSCLLPLTPQAFQQPRASSKMGGGAPGRGASRKRGSPGRPPPPPRRTSACPRPAPPALSRLSALLRAGAGSTPGPGGASGWASGWAPGWAPRRRVLTPGAAAEPPDAYASRGPGECAPQERVPPRAHSRRTGSGLRPSPESQPLRGESPEREPVTCPRAAPLRVQSLDEPCRWGRTRSAASFASSRVEAHPEASRKERPSPVAWLRAGHTARLTRPLPGARLPQT